MRTLTRVNPRRQLQASVAEFSHAGRRAVAIRFATWGVAIGGVLAGMIGGFFTFFGFDGGLPLAGLVLSSVVVAAVIVGWLRPLPELRITLEIDRRLALGERVTTALEMAQLQSVHPLADQQMADALAHLSSARPGMVFPIRLTRRALAMATLGIVFAVLPWVAPWPSLPGVSSPASQVATVSQSEAVRLDDVANRLDSQTTPSDQGTRAELAKQLRQAADALRRDGGNTQRASAALQQAIQTSSSLSPRTGEPAALTLARISDALNNQAATRPVTQALDQQNIAQATAAINQLASNVSSMTPAQRQDLANALQSASNAALSSDTNASQQLQQAAQAAQNGDPQGLQQAAQALQQLSAASQAQNDVAQASSELRSSQQALAQAGQSGLPQLSSAGTSNDQSAGAQPSDQGQGQPGAQGQPGSGQQQGNQSGDQQGGGIGKGTADHQGAPNDLQGLAQREVTVPTGQKSDTGTVSSSNQLQVGAGGQAQVDYRNVLPQYQKQALQAIEGNSVPTGLKQVVKGYFDSLAAH